MEHESINLYDSKVVGETVRRLRHEKGLTQKQLGSILGVTATTISEIESGKNRLSGFEMIEKILKVFNITYDNLFEDVLIAFMGNTEDTMEAKIIRELRLMSKEDILLASDILTYLIEHKNE